MALTVSLTLPATTALQNDQVVEVPEVTYPQAYARLIMARASSTDTYLLVCWYADADARFANADPVKVFEFPPVPTADLKGDLYPAAYTYLKTLSDFAGATDHPFVDPAEVVEPAPVEPTPEPTQPEAQA